MHPLRIQIDLIGEAKFDIQLTGVRLSALLAQRLLRIQW